MKLVADIGGTKMRVADVVGESLGEVRKIATPHDPAEGLKALGALARECARGERIEALAGCVAGSVSGSGVISNARNLRSWEGSNIIESVAEMLDAPVQFINDAALAGLGEGYAGAAKGEPSFIYVTVSTGVGGALINEGKVIDSGGIAGIKIDGADLEDIISGTAVRKRFGVEPKDLSSVEEREKLADTLALGLQVLLKRWQAPLIVLGGSMMVGLSSIPLARVETALHGIHGESTPMLKLAELGDDGGLWGGIVLLKQRS